MAHNCPWARQQAGSLVRGRSRGRARQEEIIDRDRTLVDTVLNGKKVCIFEERCQDAETTDDKESCTYIEVVAARFEEVMFKKCKNAPNVYFEQCKRIRLFKQQKI